ncbi:hypothetical protein PybrP1_003993 [[Pythium] brassicae (nom. inval.)]|nr:hypothetical protein PybrP1_003993 [[Pythium] brassicae (nom. inval.)]
MTEAQQQEEIVLEQTLFSESGVWFYQVPPTQVSTLSPRADAWDPEHPFLTGAVRVVQRGDACWVRLFEPAPPDADIDASSSSSASASPTLFAQCPVEITRELSLDAYVQDCVDSSRYFMVRVEDEVTKRRAYVGVGFPERASAFNFKAALQDHAKYALRQLEAAALSAASEAAAVAEGGGGDASPGRKSQAFSLPEGQTMRINLKLNGVDSDKLQRRRSNSGGDGASASGGGAGKVPLIPPPPGDLTPSSAAAAAAAAAPAGAFKTAQTQAASVVADDGEDWGDFTSA